MFFFPCTLWQSPLLGFTQCHCTCCSYLSMRFCLVGKTDTIKINSITWLPKFTRSSRKMFLATNVCSILSCRDRSSFFACLYLYSFLFKHLAINRILKRSQPDSIWIFFCEWSRSLQIFQGTQNGQCNGYF